MRAIFIAGSLAVCLHAAPALAQDTFYWPAPQSGTTYAQRMYVPMGTPITLATRTQVSTKDNKPGDRFYLEVTESVVFRGQVLIPAGSVAVGEVARADRNGHFGQKGKLDIRLLYLQTPYGPVKLDGHQAKEGKSGAVASFATIALVSSLGFLIHGTSATVPFGTVVRAYLAEPLAFTADPGQQGVAVAASAPVDARGVIDAVAARTPR